MPAEWRNVPVVNLSDAINLLAKYQPNRGKDIADLGTAITKQANMYPLQIHAQAEAQAKVAEANKKNQEMFDALRLSNYMRENRDQIDAILKASFNGSEGYASAIDNPTIDAFAKDAILKRASEQLGIGDTSRERAAKAKEAELRGQEALATIGLRKFQTEDARLKLETARDARQDALATREFYKASLSDPETQSYLSAAFSGNEALAAEATSRLLKKFPYANPSQLIVDMRNLPNLHPTNKTEYNELLQDIDLANEATRTALLGSTTASGMSRAELLDLAEKGLGAGLPKHIAEATSAMQTLKDSTYQNKVKEAYQKYIKEHPDHSPMFSEDLALVAGLGAVHESRLFDWFWPGTGTSIGNGRHLNDTYTGIGSDIGELSRMFADMDKSLKDNKSLMGFGNSKTGAAAEMKKYLTRQVGKLDSGFNPIRKLPSKEAFLEAQRPALENIVLGFGVDPAFAKKYVDNYIESLKKGRIRPVEFPTDKNN